jgi:chromosome segregation ATPase
MISILSRQLERHRDLLPAWVEQRNAVRIIVGRVQRELQKRSADIEKLLSEREQIEKFYTQKYDALVRGLSREQEQAASNAQAKKRELDRSLKLEHEVTHELVAQERKVEKLRSTLDQTVSQLESVQTDMQKYQEEKRRQDAQRSSHQVPSELEIARSRIEVLTKERDIKVAEKHSTQAAIDKARYQLVQQRMQSAKMEDFLRRLLQSGSAAQYVLDPTTKRDAKNVLASSGKTHSGISAR